MAGHRWINLAAIAWVLDEAPDVPPSLLSTLFAVASHAREEGRGAHPSVDTLARETRKSVRQVQRDLAQLRQLGLLRIGDPGIVKDFPVDRRPGVYDLPVHLKRGDVGVTPQRPRGDAHDTSRGDVDDATGCHPRRDGVTPTSPKEVDLKIKEEETSSSARRPTTVALVAARLSIDDDDASLIIQEIKTRHRPKSIGGYVRAVPDDDLRELLVEIKDRIAEAAAADDGLEPIHVPWCGNCEHDRARTITIPRENGRGPFAKHCPDCSPRRVRKPRANGGGFDPAAAYARALAREQAQDSRRVSSAEELADWEVDRVGGPYRNPVDQDGYDGWLADRPPERRPARRAGYGGPYRDDRVRDYHSPL